MHRVLLSSVARLSLALLAAGSISACGSSQGGSNPTPAPTPTPTSSVVNNPPQIAHQVYVDFNENGTGPVHTVSAIDLEGDPIAFSLSGPDADKFVISSGGALSFKNSPDYEATTDATLDNVYAVTVTASDGRLSAQQLVGVTVRDVTTSKHQIRKFATGVSEVTAIQPVPGDNTALFITERTGRVRLVSRTTGAIAATPFLDVSAEINIDGNRGLTAFAPAPDFAQSHIVYAAMTTKAGELEVRRYKTRAGNDREIDPASADTIFRIANTDNERLGGWIGFGQDKMLYIGVGDPTGYGQDRADLFGKLLRVDVSSDQFPADQNRDYAIPADNPFASDVRTPEIWVIGMMHPHGGRFDPVTGYLWISDYFTTGPGRRNFLTEVNMVRDKDKGLNYGPPPSTTIPDDYVYPIVYTGFGLTPPVKNEGVLVPGLVYRGPVEQYQGRYIYNKMIGTYRSVRAFAVMQSAHLPDGRSEAGLDVATRPTTGYGYDAANNLYIANTAGDIFIVEPL